VSEDVKRLIDKAHSFNDALQKSLENGEITEEEWYAINNQHFSEHYLAGDNPRAQSGHGGDELNYFHSHIILVNVIHKNGSFIDVGCANGHLLESLERWINGLDYYKLTFYGLDISQGLIDLAKKRLPQWSHCFFVGNAFFWVPEHKYDYVCVKELGYVPPNRQRQFFEHLIKHYVSFNGRLILGPFSEESKSSNTIDLISGWGYKPTGYIIKSNHKHKDISRKVLWWDIESE